MSSKRCALCELETPDPPVTDKETDQAFCCSGCLQVYKLLQDMDKEQAQHLRQQTINRRKDEKDKAPLPDNYEEIFFKVDGMHCSTCESFIETIAGRQEGIYRSEASYASEMVKIYYDPDRMHPDDLPPILSKMGYRVRVTDGNAKEEDLDEIARLIIGGFFGIIGLLLYSLFLYPTYIGGEGFIPLKETERLFFIANIFVMTSFVLFYTGFPILRGAWVSVSVLKPNMDLLVTIAAISAYLYSFGALISGSAEVYFDVTMAIILVVSIGNYYEKKIKSGKQNLLNQLAEKRIKQARVRKNGRFETVAISDLNPGDQILVKAGERIPVDGKIVAGEGVVNEALMTGESIPVAKRSGDRVLSGTILTQNTLTIKIGEKVQSTIDELLRLMWNIQSSKPGKQRLADRIATYFVPAVIILGIGTFFFHLLNGKPATGAMLSSLAVLIVSCPCALGLATPLAIASGIRSALEHDIIFKTAAVFEEKANNDIIAFDKTGTLTTGKMHLLDKGSNPEALRYAALLEQYSSHPIAKPIATSISDSSNKIQHFQSYSTGVKGEIEGTIIYVGQPEWLKKQQFEIPPELHSEIQDSRNRGHIPVGVAWNNKVRSVLVVGDSLRAEAQDIVSQLKEEGKKVALITGDSNKAAEAIQKQIQPDFLFTEARPESKSNIIQELQNLGNVAMVGDGSNDAPALANANIGIAFGDLTAIAAESAQIVIPNDRLHLILATFKAIRQTRIRIRQNLGWAFLYNIITIPLAIAGTINPLFAAAAMATSSLLVVSNSSREMNITSD